MRPASFSRSISRNFFSAAFRLPCNVEQVKQIIAAMPGGQESEVALQWNPPWDPRTDASDEVKAELGSGTEKTGHRAQGAYNQEG